MTPGGRTSDDVEEFFKTFEHPSKDAWLEVRALILAADRSIAEGIKWNVPSFRTSEYFATLHVRSRADIKVVMHLGAKARGKSAQGIADPSGILEWASADRAIATFSDLADVRGRRAAFQKVVREWITYL